MRRFSVTNYVNGVHFLKVFNLLRHRSYHLRKTARRKTILWRREKNRSKRQIILSKDLRKTARRRGKGLKNLIFTLTNYQKSGNLRGVPASL
jgi:hypothetical protein